MQCQAHQLTLQINVSFENEDTEKGSGILYNSNQDTDFYYIFTAKHCIYGKDFDKTPKEIKLKFYQKEDNYIYNENRIYISADPQIDLALIIISRRNINTYIGAIPQLKLVSDNNGHLSTFCWGYAKYNGETDKPQYIKGEIAPIVDGNIIFIPTNLSSSENTDTKSTLKGISGSGIILEANDEIYLLGIITDFKEWNRFEGFNINKFNDIKTKQLQIFSFENILPLPKPLNSHTLIKEYERQLDEMQQFINEYKINTALSRLETLQNTIEICPLQDDRKPLLAKCHSLKISCYYFLGRNDQANISTKQAYSYEKQGEAARRMMMLYHNSNEKEKALEIANQILEIDLLNPYANFVKEIYDTEWKTENSVKEDKIYKALFLAHFSSLYQNKVETFFQKSIPVLGDDFINYPEIPNEITYKEFAYWRNLAHIFLQEFLYRTPNTTFEFYPEKYKGQKQLMYSYDIYQHLLVCFENSDVKNSYTYKTILLEYNILGYLLFSKEEFVNNAFELFDDVLIQSHSFHISNILTSLLQTKKYNETLIFADKIKKYIDVFSYFAIKGRASYFLQNHVEAELFLTKSIENIDLVEADVNLWTITLLFDTFFVQQKAIEPLWESLLQNLNYKYDYVKMVLKACCFQRTLEYKSECISIYQRCEKETNVSNYIWFLVLLGYKKLAEYESACRVVKEKIPNYKNYIDVFGIYLEVCYEWWKQSHQNGKELLELLEYYRAHFTPNLNSFLIEIDLYNSLLDYETAAKIANIGYTTFNDSTFLYKLIANLYKKNPEDDVLQSLLNDSLLNINFPNHRCQYEIGLVCIKCNQIQIGLELMYRAVKNNWEDNELQLAYITDTLTLRKSFLNKVEKEGNYVRIWVKGEPKAKTIEISSYNEITKILLEKEAKVGDIIEIPRKVGKNTEITVIQVFDKYSGLAARIFDEYSETNGIGAAGAISIELKTVEDFIANMIELFGSEGDARKKYVDKNIAEYYQTKVDFIELSFRLNKFPLDVLSWLQHDKGVWLIPLQSYINTPALENEYDYVIDFSTLLILINLSKKQNILPQNKKFIISPTLIEVLRIELDNSRNMQEEQLSGEVTTSGITKTIYTSEWKKARIKDLTEILKWIDENCNVATVPDHHIDLLNQVLCNGSNDWQKNVYMKNMLYTTLLADAPNRYLLSNDRFYLNFKKLPITIEKYLLHTFPDTYNSNLLPILLKERYLGLTCNLDILKQEFEKNKLKLDNPNNTFSRAIENISLYQSLENVHILVGIVKYIHLSTLSDEYKRSLSRQIWQKNKQTVIPLHIQVLAMIEKEFYLFPNRNEIVEDLISGIKGMIV